MATLPHSPQVVAELLLKVSQDFGCPFDQVYMDITEAPKFRVELDPTPYGRGMETRDAPPARRVDYVPVPVLEATDVEARVTVGLRSAVYRATIRADDAGPTVWEGPHFVGRS